MKQLLEIDIEESLFGKGLGLICGVDEVGRGPLAGPVVAAAVILPQGFTLENLDDSKKLTARQRKKLFEQMVELEIPFGVGIIDHIAIDRINILKASLMAMRKSLSELKIKPEVILVDGVHTIPNVDCPQYAIVQGDSRCKAIAAASIIAKVTRDQIMDHYQTLYPNFSFSIHKGYPTPTHLKELQAFGPCDIHRKSFRPVAESSKEHVLI